MRGGYLKVTRSENKIPHREKQRSGNAYHPAVRAAGVFRAKGSATARRRGRPSESDFVHEEKAAMFKTTLKIDGMACGMCEAHVSDVVRRAVPGARKVMSSHKKGEASFVSDAPADADALKKALAARGARRGIRAEAHARADDLLRQRAADLRRVPRRRPAGGAQEPEDRHGGGAQGRGIGRGRRSAASGPWPSPRTAPRSCATWSRTDGAIAKKTAPGCCRELFAYVGGLAVRIGAGGLPTAACTDSPPNCSTAS